MITAVIIAWLLLLVVVIFPRKRLTAQVSDNIHARPLCKLWIAALICVLTLDYDLLHQRSTDFIVILSQQFLFTLLSELLRIGIQSLFHVQMWVSF